MKLKEWATQKLFGKKIDDLVADRLTAASSSLSAPTIEDIQWRKLTGNAARDLLPVTQDRMTEIAFWLVETNPLAGWLVDITTAFILAEGMPFESKNMKVQAVLD